MEAEDTPGKRLGRFIREAMARSTTIHSIRALERASGVGSGSIYSWFNDTERPGPRSAQRICEALGVSQAAFWSAFQGTELPPDQFTALAVKMDALAGEVANLVDLLAAQMQEEDARTRQGRALAQVRTRRQRARRSPESGA